jgi:hypothetical protein
MTNVSSFPTPYGFFPSAGPVDNAPAAAAEKDIPGIACESTPADASKAHNDGARDKRSAQGPQSVDTAAAADAELAKAYAKALATRSFETSISPPNVQVPAQSTLGQWRALLDSALTSSRFLSWANKHQVDTKHLKLDPDRGELTCDVGGERHTFSLSDVSGWADVSRTLLAIAKALATEPGQTLTVPWPEGEVAWDVVGKFYGKPTDLTPAQAIEHRDELQKNTKVQFPPLPHASLRSRKAMAEHQEALGDEANTQALITALNNQVDDASGTVDLSKVMVPIDPRSAYFNDGDPSITEVSAEQLIEDYQMNVPENVEQARNLANALDFDFAVRAPKAEQGGAQPLTRGSEPTTLDNASRDQLQQTVVQWKAQNPVGPSGGQSGVESDSLLGRLLGYLPENTRKAIRDNPAAALDAVTRSPEARELGKKIQAAVNGVETPTSAIEYVSAALALEMDPAGGASRSNLAGYNLYSQENVGASPAQIVGRFIQHLEGKVGAEQAPIVARLLLSVSAPELLAKDLPPSLVFGSHTWVTYAIDAWRIEKQVPGSVANMTYSQVILFGQTTPISTQTEKQLKEVRRPPMMDWGRANEVIGAEPNGEFSAIDYNLSVTAMLKQQKELEWASGVLKSKPTTREALALTELERVFGKDIDFKKKVIVDSREVWPDIKKYSLLDLYMSGHLGQKVWKSTDEKAVPYDTMRHKFSQLADINKTFEDEFAKFRARHELAFNTLFRYHLSLMPVADREVFNNANISFLAVREPYKVDSHVRVTGQRVYYPAGKPSPQETKALTGHHGLLIRANLGNGQIRYYSYFPGESKIISEPGLTQPVLNKPQEPWKPSHNDPGDELGFDDRPYHGEPAREKGSTSRVLVELIAPPDKDRASAKVPSDSADGLHGSYFSARSQALGKTVSTHFTSELDDLKSAANGVTEREKEIAKNKKLTGFFLSLVPFYDGVVAAINGNAAGAVFEFGFDAFGFLLPGGKGVMRGLKAGHGVLKSIAKGVFKGLGASFGYGDFFDGSKNFKKGLNVLGRGTRKVHSSGRKLLGAGIRSFDENKVYKHRDVVSNFYYKQFGNPAKMGPVTAIFLHGAWYAYNIVTKTPAGVQMVQYGVVQAIKP